MGNMRLENCEPRPCPTDVAEDEADASTLDFEAVCDGLRRCVTKQSQHREIYIKTLTFCDEEKAEPDVETFIQSLPEFAYETQSPCYLISALVHAGGLERFELDEEGEVITTERKEGLSEDEVDDLIWSIAYRTTAAGMTVAQDMAPQARMDRLVQACPARKDTYCDVLAFCLEPKKRTEVEELLRGRQILTDEAVDGEPLQPSVFIDKLERTGALEWHGAWLTSAAGKAYLEEHAC